MLSKLRKTSYLWLGPVLVTGSQSYKHFVKGEDFNYMLLLLVIGVVAIVELISRRVESSSQH